MLTDEYRKAIEEELIYRDMDDTVPRYIYTSDVHVLLGEIDRLTAELNIALYKARPGDFSTFTSAHRKV